MTILFNVLDYGATANDASDDTAAIAAAVNAARMTGGGTVYIPAGTFLVSGDPENPSAGGIELYSDIDLLGAGAGQTIVKLVDGFDARINGIVRTTPSESVRNVTISNLTIDGNRAANEGHQAGFICGVKEDGSGRVQQNITLDSVEARNCNGYGIDPHEFTHDMVIRNCVSHHNADDGITLDGIIGGLVENNVCYENDRHGFNITTSSSNVRLVNNVSHDNGSSGLVVQRGDIFAPGTNDVDWPSQISIEGGSFHGNAREGILIKLSDHVTVSGATIRDNLLQGVRIEGATNTRIENNTIHDNAKLVDGTYDQISIRPRVDTVSATPRTYASTDTVIANNTFYETGEIHSRYSIREENSNSTADAPSGTLVLGNTVSGARDGAYFIPPYSVTDGDDFLPGTGSGDAFAGGLGNDVYIVNHSGDTVLEVANGGVDLVVSSLSWTLPAHVENLTLNGSALRGTGNAANNVLVGNAADNQLWGLGGRDVLDGGAGADRMTGGDDDDVYLVDNIGDTIIEKANSGLGGYDTVISSVSYALPDQVEAITLIGSGNLSATGNGLNNVLTGNAGDNVLDGRGGADRMVGGAGDDTYHIDHTGDLAVEEAGGGIDRVLSSLSHTLAAAVEDLVLVGTNGLNGTGNTLANTLVGNDGDNRLHGMGGNDVLEGGLGSDQLYGDAGDDLFVFRRGEFRGDTIEDFVGNGPAAGDQIVFFGFSASASLVHVGGNVWQVSDNGYTESFTLKGPSGSVALDASDYVFDGAQSPAAFAAVGPDHSFAATGIDPFGMDSFV